MSPNTSHPPTTNMRDPRQPQANTKLFISSKKRDRGPTVYDCDEDDVRSSTDSIPSTSANIGQSTDDHSHIQEHGEAYRFETITKAAVIYYFTLFMLDQQGSLTFALSILLFASYPEWFQRWTIFIPLLGTMSPFAKLQVVFCLSLISWLS